MIDLHTHILPGFDDGARNEEESLRMVRGALLEGISTLVATPHVLPGQLKGAPDRIRRRVEKLTRELERHRLCVDVLAGAEVFLDPQLLDEMETVSQLTLNGTGRYLLVELPMQDVPPYVHEVLFRLALKGISPVLAHPERNLKILTHPEVLETFVRQDVLLQVNADSLTGRYGPRVEELSERLLAAGVVQLLASDGHRAGLRPVSLKVGLQRAMGLLGANEAKKLVEENPLKIINGESLDIKSAGWSAGRLAASKRNV